MIKALGSIVFALLGMYTMSKGFSMHNSSAADIFFGSGFLLVMLGFFCWLN